MQENCAEPSCPHRQVALLNDMVPMLVFNALQDLKSQTNSSHMLRLIKIHVNHINIRKCVEISRLKMAMFPSTLSPPKKSSRTHRRQATWPFNSPISNTCFSMGTESSASWRGDVSVLVGAQPHPQNMLVSSKLISFHDKKKLPIYKLEGKGNKRIYYI